MIALSIIYSTYSDARRFYICLHFGKYLKTNYSEHEKIINQHKHLQYEK